MPVVCKHGSVADSDVVSSDAEWNFDYRGFVQACNFECCSVLPVEEGAAVDFGVAHVEERGAEDACRSLRVLDCE